VKAKTDADSSSDEGDESSEEENERLSKVKKEKLKKDLKKEEQELGKILMTKKQRKLLDHMERS